MTTAEPAETIDAPRIPWNALWAMMIGFFMILVDSTIVAVANPSIMEKLQTDYDAVIWVTSAYLLAYAVPLLLAGRLGDQFGPKNLYLTGLFVFTAASLWCGLSGSIETLIAARVVQGIGAALLTPQTLSTITRIFPADRRGAAMSVWGATAGVATLVGPLAGGVLVDHLGWQWIFFVNVPIGIIGLVLAVRLVPVLPTNRHRFDVLGVVLSGAAMFLVVFGLQEGESHQWSAWIWAMIGGGAAVMVAFVVWQAVNKSEPLIPLRIFRDRNFSLANIGVAVIGFSVVAMVVPVMFYAQVVCDLSPTQIGAADGADGHRDRRARSRRRQDRRSGPSAAHHRLRLLGAGHCADLVVGGNDRDHPDLATAAAVHRDGRRDGLHLGAVGGHRDTQSARADGRCRFWCVQRDAAGRVGARQCWYRGVHDIADQCRNAGWTGRASRRWWGDRTAGILAGAVRRRAVAGRAAACVCCALRCDCRGVLRRWVRVDTTSAPAARIGRSTPRRRHRR